MVKFMDQVQWELSRDLGISEAIITGVSNDVFCWTRFLPSSLLHMQNKYRNRLDMITTGQTPCDLNWATCKLPWKSLQINTNQWCRRRECSGCSALPKIFDLSNIWAISLKIRAKIAPNAVWFKKWRPTTAEKRIKTFFWSSYQKKSTWSLQEKICRRSPTKTFRSSLGKFGWNSFASPIICLLLHL